MAGTQKWYERDPSRLVLEQQAMRDRFPRFQMARDQGEIMWVGPIRTPKGNVYQVAIKYPPAFPERPPDAYPVDPAIAVYKSGWSGALEHQYADGRMCLYFPGDRNLQEDATAATVVALAATWLFAYESWLDSGKSVWPGKAAPH